MQGLIIYERSQLGRPTSMSAQDDKGHATEPQADKGDSTDCRPKANDGLQSAKHYGKYYTAYGFDRDRSAFLFTKQDSQSPREREIMPTYARAGRSTPNGTGPLACELCRDESKRRDIHHPST